MAAAPANTTPRTTGGANTLFISQSAVEKHVNSIFAKLTLRPEDGEHHRRVAAVRTFLRNRDIGAPDDGEWGPSREGGRPCCSAPSQD